MTHQPLSAARAAAARVRSLLPALLLPAILVAQEETRPLKHPDGTTHWYRAVAVTGGVTWQQAHESAIAAGGYLASVTSAAENEFVFGLVDRPEMWAQTSKGEWQGPWLGGIATTDASGRKAYAWTELEPFAYSNWDRREPSNSAATDRIHFSSNRTGRGPTWADEKSTARRNGYVIEFSGALSPRTVGLLTRTPASQDGYTLLNLLNHTDTILIGPRGREIRRWNSKYGPGVAAYLLPDGHLMRAGTINSLVFDEGGVGGIIEKFDWSGKRVWSFTHSSSDYTLHHDFEVLPNGNVLMIAWERKTEKECLDAGRSEMYLGDGELWPLKIIEVKPSTTGEGGTIVWEWHAFDHIIQDLDPNKPNHGTISEHPHRININYYDVDNADWMHTNSIDYHPKRDQILISVRAFCEVWVIDHSTTTAQAKTGSGGNSGMGGDLLYRWGNPQAYGRGDSLDRRLFYQHDAQWIPPNHPGAGNILVYNNGPGRTNNSFSSVDEIVPPALDANGHYPVSDLAWGPSDPTWSYSAPGFYSAFISGVQRLSNGNTLICSGVQGRAFEVTPKKEVVWDYNCPLRMGTAFRQGTPIDFNYMFRAPRYAPDYGAFKGRDLTPGEPLEAPGSALLANGSTVDEYARPGDAVRLDVRLEGAPDEPQRLYQVVTSMTEGSIPVDFRAARLGADPLLDLSLTNTLGSVFQGYFGRLDAKGRAVATLKLPLLPALRGASLHSVFAVFDPAAPSGVHFLSNRVTVHVGN